MKKVLITGGTGTVGRAFIDEYIDLYEFAVMSRNETNIAAFKQKYPNVTTYIGDVANINDIHAAYSNYKPDIVIHAAAMKHINLCEENPTAAVTNNITGVMNIILLSKAFNIPITVGISSDKACNTNSVYGMTKKLMEKLFFEAHTSSTKFVCTRFANVLGSNGSVVPFFIDKAKRGEPLPVTDMNMNRLMITKNEAAMLIYKAIYLCNVCDNPLIVCKLSKAINIDALARAISYNIDYVGKRPGEALNETLIRADELPYTFLIDSDLACIGNTQMPKVFNNTALMLQREYSSETAEFLSPVQIKQLISKI